MHGLRRGSAGLGVSAGLAEFRGLREGLLLVWRQSDPASPPRVDKAPIGFNGAIGQAPAESVARYSSDKDKTMRRFDVLLSSLS